MSEQLLQCPLITEYTIVQKISSELLEKLFAVRHWEIDPEKNPIPFKWPKLLRTTIWDPLNNIDTGEPLVLRQYQIQQIHHMTRMDRYINGDSVGLGKTIDAIGAASWLKERFPEAKIVVLTTKSMTYQWQDEFCRFSFLQPYVMRDSYKGMTSSDARYAQMISFLEGDKKDILICKYTSLIGRRRKIEGKFDEEGNPVEGGIEKVSQEIKNFCQIFKKHRKNIILILDECHKFKTVGSQTRTLVSNLSKFTGRCWALSATVIKNGLDEMYSIASAIGIKPLGSMGDFNEEYCLWDRVYIGHGMHQKVLRGFTKVAKFKQELRPFFLGRSQRQVKEPLPILTTVYHPVDLDARQSKLLLEDIPNGVFQLPPTLIQEAGQIFEKERDPGNMMTMLSVYQLVANHWALLDRHNEKDFHTKTLSPKEETLLDMLDGDYRGEKVIVYTKYRSWIDRLEWITANKGFTERKFLRITGNESETQRSINQKLFQDPNSGYDLIVINAAGMEGINLQQAAHMIMLDVPWSWGDLIQLVGRMVRMASPHSACTLHVMAARGTIDEYAIETLKGKKGVFEKILGESHSAGILDDKVFLNLDSGMEATASDEEFKSLMRAYAKKSSMKNFLIGDHLIDAQSNDDYKMTFEKGGSKRKKKVNIADVPDEELRW